MTTDAAGDRESTDSLESSDEAPATPAPVSEPAKKPDDRKHLPVWQESVLLLGIALVLAIVIKTFFVQAFYIPSESMEPGLQINDRILVQKVSYWFGGDPHRGDAVVFEDPGGWLNGEEPKPTGLANLLSKVGLYPTGGHLVKRVIGTEGDVIKCCDDQGRIMVNGEPIDESSYLAKEHGACAAALPSEAVKAGTTQNATCDWSIGPVPAGKLFVMGDNRGQSSDSRFHMCRPNEQSCTKSPWVDTDLVVGKVFALVWPRDHWRWISNPGAFDDVPDDPPADE